VMIPWWSIRRSLMWRCSWQNTSSSVTIISPDGRWKHEVSSCHFSIKTGMRRNELNSCWSCSWVDFDHKCEETSGFEVEMRFGVL
jgi:hypothetical protein